MYAKDRTTIVDRREMLRVKLASLVAEAHIIRREEKRTPHGALRCELSQHRRSVVRDAARLTHLAYGFIRGRTWAQIERNPTTLPSWGEVRKMLKRYGPAGMAEPECMR